MAIALVKLGTAATTLSPAFGQATASGNLLVAWLFDNDSGGTDPFGTAASGWARAAAGGAAFGWAGIWYKPNCATGETAPVFTSAGSSLTRTLLGEFSGAVTASPLDSAGGNAGSNAAIQTAACAAADAASGDLLLFAAGWNGGSGTSTIALTMADGTGAAVTPHETKDVATSAFYYDFAWGVTGASGASHDTGTGTLGQTATGAAVAASFKAAISGTTSGPNSPSAGADLGGGTGSWTSPGNITADDAAAATWAVT